MLDFTKDNTTGDDFFQIATGEINFPSGKFEDTQSDFQSANLMDASTFLLIGLNAPEQVRRIFPGLLGMLAGRSTKVEFTRLQLGRRIFGGRISDISGKVNEVDRKRIEQRMTDHLGIMRDWIHRENLEDIVKYQAGSKTEPSIIETRILKWIVEVSRKAGDRLSGNESDFNRRQVFEEEVKSLLKRKKRTIEPRDTPRQKRQDAPSVLLAMAKGVLKRYYKAAKVREDAEQVKAFLKKELQDFIDRIPTEISGEYLTSDDRKALGTQGGDSLPIGDFDCSEGTCRVKFHPDDWETRGEVDAMLEDKVMVDTPPCVPDADGDNLMSDGSKAITAITAGRDGDHWQAIRLAASVGAIPVNRLLGGTGDAIPEREVRKIDSIPDFVTSFDALVRKSVESQRSLILSLSPCVFHRDDCTSGDVEKLRSYSWMITQTSPGSYQVWFRLADDESGPEGRRRFHAILTAAGIGGNPGATHSGRWPGSVNGKAKHQGWQVQLTGGQAGRVVTLDQMTDAFPSPSIEVKTTPRDERSRSTITRTSKSGFRGAMPDYEKCLIGRRSRSEADASFIRIAMDRGFDVDEIYSGLVAVSERAASMSEAAVLADIRRLGAKYVH